MADMRHAAAHRSMLLPTQPWPNRGFKEDQWGGTGDSSPGRARPV